VGKVFEEIDDKLAGWIRRQRLFFVAAAPSGPAGHVNLSPKGPIESLALLNGRTLAYLDVIGSGVETIAHLRDDGRITVMLCAFEGPPRIVRLHGRGEVVEAGEEGFAELAWQCGFQPGPNARAIVRVRVERIADSCGYGVPLMDYVGERPQQAAWVERKLAAGATALEDYKREKNAASIDGLPGLGLPAAGRGPRAILGADWSGDARRRAVWVALPEERTVGRLDAAPTVPGLVAAARQIGGGVLIGIDAPIGVPRSYLEAARRSWGLDGASFLEWLAVAVTEPAFFTAVRSAPEWSVRTPFFHVPAGMGGRTGFEVAARAHGVELWRGIDRDTHATSMFALGLPGQVAPAAQALWRELVAARALGLRVWPFDGRLDELLAEGDAVVAEIYPRAAYATALARTLPARPMALKKRNVGARRDALEQLESATWVTEHGVRLDDLSHAAAGEDDFDACLTCAALLRLVLEGRPLAEHVDAEAEGAMLGV
jgi:Pyridoxamine 5'-phosphate oxidase/Protein of unknown function (DUF429)